LLRAASKRTQLFITTHSDALVDALTDSAEAIVVCEPGDNGTQLKRLEPDKLKDWLKRYSLGELWMKGEIGGARW
jgi:predicted ATPase